MEFIAETVAKNAPVLVALAVVAWRGREMIFEVQKDVALIKDHLGMKK